VVDLEDLVEARDGGDVSIKTISMLWSLAVLK